VPSPQAVLGFVTRAGGGSVRDSLSVLDQLIAGSGDEGVTYEGAAALLGFTSVELLDATIDALAARDAGAVFAQVDKVIESGQDPRRFAMDLLERLRDLIIVAAVPDGAAQVLRGVPEDQLDRMRGQQSRFGPGTLSRAADIVNAGITEMTGATSPRLQLELICARILLPGASGESGYAARLDRIERHLDAGGGVPAGLRPSMPAPPAQAPAAQAPPAQAPARCCWARGGTGSSPSVDACASTSITVGAGGGRGGAACGCRSHSAGRPRGGSDGATDLRGWLRCRFHPPGVARGAGPHLRDAPGDVDLRLRACAGHRL
jgi:DNA polymerase-3 subunit gamma/tau